MISVVLIYEANKFQDANICCHFNIYWHDKLYAQLSWA